mgnify:CR=1 FL=1
MQYTTISELYRDPAAFAGRVVTIGGFLRTQRDLKDIVFLEVSDGTHLKTLQAVANEKTRYELQGPMSTGAALRIEGTLALTPQARQPFELQADYLAGVVARKLISSSGRSHCRRRLL